MGHPDRRSFPVKLADRVYGRFRATGAKEDLDKAIAGALELPSPGNSERWSVPINVTDRLYEIHECQAGEFRGRSSLWWPLVGSADDPNRRSCVIRKATAGLDEAITLWRVALEFTPSDHRERPSSLVNIADPLKNGPRNWVL